jgi:tetratricopeptide (TPR) repeat protein
VTTEERLNVPAYLAGVMHGTVPVGTCFQLRPGILVTAYHVIKSIDAESGAANGAVSVMALDGSTTCTAEVAGTFPESDIAILTCQTSLKESIRCLIRSDEVDPNTPIIISGVAGLDDPGHEYRYLEATGSWQGGSVRDGRQLLGRARIQDIIPGMSGCPVRHLAEDCVVGMLIGRFQTLDGWMRDTAWICRTEDILTALDTLGINILIIPLPGKKRYPRVQVQAAEELNYKFTELYYKVKVEDRSDGWEQTVLAAEDLLTKLNLSVAIGEVGLGVGRNRVIASSTISLTTELLSRTSTALTLLPIRARLRERLGEWFEALGDIQVLADVVPLSPDVLYQAGSLLMTLGNYHQARLLLSEASRLGTGIPSDDFNARALEAWIDDYQGRHGLALRKLEALRQRANSHEVSNSVEGGIEHRMARALYQQAIKHPSHQDELLRDALKLADQGRRKLSDDNPFSFVWMSRIAARLEPDLTNQYRNQAYERLVPLGDSARGHLHLLRADEYISQGRQRQAMTELRDALDQWKLLRYSKGVHDSARRLGRLYLEVGTGRDDLLSGIFLTRLAERIATKQGFHERNDSQNRLRRSLARISDNPATMLMQADTRCLELSFSEFFEDFTLHLPHNSL